MDIILDFDGTITVEDTLDVLVRSIIHWRVRHEPLPPNVQELTMRWEDICKSYATDLSNFEAARGSPDQRTDIIAQLAHFRSRESVEAASLERIRVSRLFPDDMPAKELEALGAQAFVGGKIRIRGGLRTLVLRCATRGWRLKVLSANWSESFIRGVLKAWAISEACSDVLRDVAIVANEIEGGEVRGPRLWVGTEPPRDRGDVVATCADKLNAIPVVLARPGPPQGLDNRMVYIGDSTADIECLLLDIGVVMSSDGDSPLIQVLRRAGCPLLHVSKATKFYVSPSVWWARDFTEIVESNIGLHSANRKES